MPDAGAVPSFKIEQTRALLVCTKLLVVSIVPAVALNAPAPADRLSVGIDPPAWYCAGATPKLTTHLPEVT